MDTDIRWIQRFGNYCKALDLLASALEIEHPSDLETEGLIQRFEYTFELAWKTLKDYLEDRGFAEIVDSREAIRLAFANGIIFNGEIWMNMVTDRNLTSHIYDIKTALSIAENIRKHYIACFVQLKVLLETKSNG